MSGTAKRKRLKISEEAVMGICPPRLLDVLVGIRVQPKESRAFETALKPFYDGSAVFMKGVTLKINQDTKRYAVLARSVCALVCVYYMLLNDGFCMILY